MVPYEMMAQDFSGGKSGVALLSKDRLFPADPTVRAIARALYSDVVDLPIVSPHGHTDPRWYALNEPSGSAQLLVVPDHYVFRMLFSQGVPLEELGVPRSTAALSRPTARAIWRLFRVELSSVSRHPDAAVARPHF
jgi:glucuronate isomerase